MLFFIRKIIRVIEINYKKRIILTINNYQRKYFYEKLYGYFSLKPIINSEFLHSLGNVQSFRSMKWFTNSPFSQ